MDYLASKHQDNCDSKKIMCGYTIYSFKQVCNSAVISEKSSKSLESESIPKSK